jgi:hypothetical protein
MSGQTLIGNRVSQFPIAKGVGQQHTPIKAGSSQAAPSVAVPPPAPLIVNGRKVQIDVRSMSGADIVAVLNGVPGVSASIDGSNSLVVTGVNSIDGDPNLRAILGI